MYRLLLTTVLSLASCFVVTPDESTPTQESVLVAIVRQDGGCSLSKVQVYDDRGDQYQVEGCTWGEVVFPEGRQFGWVEYAGGGVKSYAVFRLPVVSD